MRPDSDKKMIDMGHLNEALEGYITVNCGQKSRSHTTGLRESSFMRESASPTRRRRTPRQEEVEQNSTHTEEHQEDKPLEAG